MTTTHTIKARQRNDRELATVANRLELLEAQSAVLLAEIQDLRVAERGLLAQAVALRDAGGQL
jgi:hypothetical protein